MSDGKSFVETVRRIGYPVASTLNPSSLDWLFDNQALVPFLEWFCDEIQSSNVLQPHELTAYAELESQQSVILEGEELDNALRSHALLSGHAHTNLSIDQLREEVSVLDEECRTAKRRRDTLVWQRDKLTMHQTALSDRASQLNAAVSGPAKAELRKCVDQCQLDNEKTNSTLVSLASAVSLLTEQYRHASVLASTADGPQASAVTQTNVGRDTRGADFLSSLDLHEYHDSEDGFSRDLTAFTKKQFFDGIAEMVGQTDGSRYELLEISDPDSQLIHGERESVSREDCKDLARLQSIYPVSECNRVSALVDECRVNSAVQFHERMASKLKDHPYPSDLALLSARLHEAQALFSSVNKHASRLSELQIPALIKENAALQTVSILRGDYDLKIARQDYFTTNQDKVISELVVQRSRTEFLTMALELELRGHKNVHKLLTAISLQLSNMHAAWTSRMKHMCEVEKSVSRVGRTTIDSRDKFLLRLYDNLRITQRTSIDCDPDSEHTGTNPHQQLFVSYAQLANVAEKFGRQITANKASLSTTNHRIDQRVVIVEDALARCESVLYAGGAAKNRSKPVLSPQPIVESLARLNTALNSLERAVLDIVKDVEVKNKMLRDDGYKAIERLLFPWFFNDPNELRQTFKKIDEQLQELLVK